MVDGSAPPPPRRERKKSFFPPIAGALLVAAGFFGLLAVLDVYDVGVPVVLAAAVAVVGAGVVAGFQLERRIGGLIFLGLLLLAAFGVAAASPVSFSSGFGDRNERPLAPSSIEREYELGIGDLTLELADADLAAGTTHVRAKVGIGELVVTVSEDAALVIDARTGLGRVDVLGREDDDPGAHERVSEPGATELTRWAAERRLI